MVYFGKSSPLLFHSVQNDLYTSVQFSFSLVSPAFDLLLPCTRHGECAGGNVACDRRARSNIRSLAHRNGRDEVRVAADEGIVLDDCAELLLAVVVDRDRAAAHVDVRTEVAVPDVGEMRQFRALTDVRILHLNKITDLHTRTDVTVGADMVELPKLRAVLNLGIMRKNVVCFDIVADNHILEADIGARKVKG